jgi:pyridoxamine 5'-phosphate oxidase
VSAIDPDIARAGDPLATFERWYTEALRAGVPQADAMALATATKTGVPSVRMVLYKGRSGEGIRFFTNYGSRKAQELDDNPVAALCMWWQPLARQVRMEGPVARLDAADSDAYFATRPRGSQIGAWVSPQSRPIESAVALERAAVEAERKWSGADVPRPPFWGGYVLVPALVEFWVGGGDRLHTRFRHVRGAAGWTVEALGP